MQMSQICIFSVRSQSDIQLYRYNSYAWHTNPCITLYNLMKVTYHELCNSTYFSDLILSDMSVTNTGNRIDLVKISKSPITLLEYILI